MENCIPICRVCMQKSPEYFNFDMPLQNENEEDTSITYLDFFFECTRIEVEPHEGEPQCFCLPCGDELRSFYKFIKIAEMTDRTLKQQRMAKWKNLRKNDSTFETIAWEPESEDEYTPNEELLNEMPEEGSTENEEIGSKNGYSGFNETISDQRLLDLRVEIFQSRESILFSSSDSVLDKSNDHKSNSIAITKDLPVENSVEDRNERCVNLTGINYKKGPVECAFCHEVLKNRKRLDKHLIDEHQRRTQPCEICGKMVIRMRDHLLIHYREKNDISRPKIECPICLRKVSKQTISRHIRYVHKREVRKQKCPQCLQTFADAHKLKLHMGKGHSLEKNLKCPLCSRKFSNAISLNNHLRTHPCLERQSQEKVFPCDKCPMIFNAKKLFDYHKRIHNTEGYDCGISDQRFSGKESLHTF